jgi:omega-6 fatty acid desaturase (delta-12 desaturase)
MTIPLNSLKTIEAKTYWYNATSKFAQPTLRKVTWQVLSTFPLYFALWALMLHTVRNGYSYLITLLLAVAAAAPLIRIFCFFHDCCHGSFFASLRVNRIIGYVSGILTFTPFEDWQRSHADHHLTLGDLDRRGVCHVWMLTVEEYLAAPLRTRLIYRLYRNPFIMFGLGPVAKFLIDNRFSTRGARKRERNSVIFTNLAILVIMGVASLTIGIKAYLLIQLPIVLIGGASGLWLFFIQHQFEGVYFARHGEWDPIRAALDASSYYKLPRILQWISGNIGFHHVHHIRPKIPNYNLPQCYASLPALQVVEPLTILKSLKSLWLHLWDEKQRKLISFKSLREGQRTMTTK